MRIVSIASGSQGNATIVEHEGSAVLVDCGVPYCALKNFEFDAVLVTHSHTDHVSGLKTDRKSTRLNSSHPTTSRMPSSA